MPAISVGIIHKTTDFNALQDTEDVDYYVVATKTLTQLPAPIVLSAGALSTKGYVSGVLGFGDDHDEAFFGNIDIVIKSLIVGFEYTQGTDVGEDPAGEPLSTDEIWEAHVAWMHKDLTLVVAYNNFGRRRSL